MLDILLAAVVVGHGMQAALVAALAAVAMANLGPEV
jgi:hypothetical protein